jgi:hypothetical protein
MNLLGRIVWGPLFLLVGFGVFRLLGLVFDCLWAALVWLYFLQF